MISCVLVPLDGSARAEQAIPVAAHIARASRARLLLVCALVIPTTYGINYEGRLLRWRVILDETQAARDYLGTVAQSADLTGLPVKTVVKVGPPADVIRHAAQRLGADLVVMTSHGRTGLARVVMGSVAEHVVHHAAIPVLLVRDHAYGALGNLVSGENGMLRMLVTLDGSPLAEAVLAPVHALALALSVAKPVEIHLMLVVAPYVDMPESMPDALIVDGANAYLERTAQHLLRHSDENGRINVRWTVVAHGDIAQAIVAAAETTEAGEKGDSHPNPPYDLIAMATHGRGKSFLARLALGRVTDRVLHQSKLPLLVVRPREAATPTATNKSSRSRLTLDRVAKSLIQTRRRRPSIPHEK